MLNTIEQYKNNVVERFYLLSERDRRAFVVLIIFLFVVSLYFFVWQPLSAWQEAQMKHYKKERQTLQYVQSNISWLGVVQKRMEYSSSQGDLTAKIKNTASNQGINLGKINTSKDGVFLFIPSVSYKKLVSWLVLLHNMEEIEVQQIKIEQTNRNNLVKVFVQLVSLN